MVTPSKFQGARSLCQLPLSGAYCPLSKLVGILQSADPIPVIFSIPLASTIDLHTCPVT